MMAITPIAEEILRTVMPLGRSNSASTCPKGEGRETTSKMPCDMPLMRPASKRSLSSITSEMRPRAASRSAAFASKMADVFSINAFAIAVNAASSCAGV